ncbi:redoxin [Chitinophaga alhagiae]|uniref:Redoxin n=1 Tax=Chitinophaga alhagiae TaxID=2203219 RepID=A0ABM6W950_9BACT|nr:TlpA disulfide reductase family protein [Chitinophaga alhagiae]AWO00448.1 redoxin [Chitinophaga alhagiae]
MRLFFFLLLCCHAATAQQVRRIGADELKNVLHHPDSALVINLWATWCAPCIKELPWFEQLAQQMKNKPVKFIFLSLDMEDAYPQQINRFITQNKIRSTVLWLDEPNANKYASLVDPRWQGSIPATIFLSKKKNYRRFVAGEITQEELRKQVSMMLE